MAVDVSRRAAMIAAPLVSTDVAADGHEADQRNQCRAVGAVVLHQLSHVAAAAAVDVVVAGAGAAAAAAHAGKVQSFLVRSSAT